MQGRTAEIIKATGICTAAGGAIGVVAGYTINGEALCQNVAAGLFDKSITIAPDFKQFLDIAVGNEFKLFRDHIWDVIRDYPNNPVFVWLAGEGAMTLEAKARMYSIALQASTFLLNNREATFITSCAAAISDYSFLPKAFAAGTLVGLTFGIVYNYLTVTPEEHPEPASSDAEKDSDDEYDTLPVVHAVRPGTNPTLFARKSELITLKEKFGMTVRDLGEYVEQEEAPTVNRSNTI